MADIFMVSDSTSHGKRTSKMYDIKQITEQMNHGVLKYLLVIHAFGGCDTTSGIHEKGKNAALKLVTKSMVMDDIGPAGLDIFIELMAEKVCKIDRRITTMFACFSYSLFHINKT